MTKTEKIRQALTADPSANPKDVAKRLDAPLSLVYKVRKLVLEQPKPAASPAPASPTAVNATTFEPSTALADMLEERGKRYGKFKDHSQITQEIKRVMSRHAQATGRTFTDSQWEALEMIAHKIGRIVNGDPDHVDSWADIAGYAQLVADELQGVER